MTASARILVRRDASGVAAAPGRSQGQRFTLSTSDEDRALDVVVQDWARSRGEGLRDFRANPVVIDNGDPMRVIGRALSVDVVSGVLEGRIAWDTGNPDPKLASAAQQHERGFRHSVEALFRSGRVTKRSKLPPSHPHYRAPTKIETEWGSHEVDGYLFEQNTLLALSSATIPRNPSTLSARSFDLPSESMDRAAEGRLKEALTTLFLAARGVRR